MLPRSPAEAQGISSDAVHHFLDEAERAVDALHSVVIVRHGHVVTAGWWHPYRAEAPHMLFSLSKSFTSTAVGLAVAEGLVALDDPLVEHLPELAGAEGDRAGRLARLTLRHLLTMSTGQRREPTGEMTARLDGDWAAGALSVPLDDEPGTAFVYNSSASYLLSAVVQRAAGVTLLEYLRPRLLEPLGITDATWDTCPRGVTAGGFGLHLRTEEIARFGELYLRGGRWQGRQLVPEAWVRAATARHVDTPRDDDWTDWQQGYGYHFWQSRHGYRGDGAFGQFCLVLPEHDAVVAITSGTADLPGVLEVVWRALLPALGGAPLPPDDDAHARLQARLSGLRLPTVAGAPTSPVAERVSGRTFRTDPAGRNRVRLVNRSTSARLGTVRLDAAADGSAVLHLVDDRGEHAISCGHGRWIEGTTAFGVGEPVPVVASGAWVKDDVYVADVRSANGPFCRTVTLRFEGPSDGPSGSVEITFGDNVSFVSTQPTTLRATLQDDHPQARARTGEQAREQGGQSRIS